MESIEPDDDVLAAYQAMKKGGYLIALDDFDYRPGLEKLLGFADIVKVAFRSVDPGEQIQHVRKLSNTQPKLLAEQVETKEEYEQAAELGFDYFQGYFFCRPEIVEARALSGSRLTYLRLLQAVTRPEMNIDEVDKVIRADVAVTHRLLKYLASPAHGFRSEIRSVQHGLALLGKEKTRRFVSVLALGELGTDKPQELLVSAAVRGKFCEQVGDELWMADRKPELFLLGALSMIDALLDQPMPKILSELSLSDDLNAALLGDSSPLLPVLEFTEGYERGDWTRCSELGQSHAFAGTKVLERYREAISWAAQALTS